MENEKIIHHLNHIIARNFDAAEDFQNATNHVKSPALKKIFIECSAQRQMFASEVQEKVKLIGGDPQPDANAPGAGSLIRTELRSALLVDNDEAILDACVTREQLAVREYEDFLQNDGIPLNLRIFLSGQCDVVKGTLIEIQELANVLE